MKKLQFLTTILGLALAVTSCAKQGEPKEGFLWLDPADAIEFTHEGGSETITVNTDRGTWNVSSNQTWCVVSPASGEHGGTFTITAEPNSGAEPMPTATVSVTAEGITQTITVDQKANVYNFKSDYLEMIYYEERSTESAGYYSFKFTHQPDAMNVYYMGVALYGDIMPDRASLRSIPRGTFNIATTMADGTLAPGTIVSGDPNSPMSPMVGSYMMHLEHQIPHQALLMKSGTMTVSGDGDNLNDPIEIVMEFVAEDVETGETVNFRGEYSYKGDEAHLPIMTWVPQEPIEEFNTTFTTVKTALVQNGDGGARFAVVTLGDATGFKEAQFMVFVDAGVTELPAGTYENFDYNNKYAAGTIAPGVYSPGYGSTNTFYVENNPNGLIYDVVLPLNGYSGKQGVLIDGVTNSITVAKSGSTYDIDIELYGANQRCSGKSSALKGSYNGPIVFPTAPQSEE